jgi:hypothetical protein
MTSLSGSSWGQCKKTLLLTFKCLIRPVIDFGSVIWYPNASATSVKKLQTTQNSALRIATGNHMMAPVEHLHVEAGVLTVDSHLRLLNSQFLASALCPSHVSHEVVNLPPGPRKMKQTLYSSSIDSVRKYLHNGVAFKSNNKKTMSSLHTDAVSAELCRAGPSKSLGLYPPKVDPSEETLPRIHQCTLMQLRAGYCWRLNAYKHRIGKSYSELCPECGEASQTPRHLFDCRAFPTDLVYLDTWRKPREVAIFVSNLPAFILHLPPVPPQRWNKWWNLGT